MPQGYLYNEKLWGIIIRFHAHFILRVVRGYISYNLRKYDSKESFTFCAQLLQKSLGSELIELSTDYQYSLFVLHQHRYHFFVTMMVMALPKQDIITKHQLIRTECVMAAAFGMCCMNMKTLSMVQTLHGG